MAALQADRTSGARSPHLLDSLRLYLRYIGVSAQAQTQYKASFVMLSIGAFGNTGLEFLTVWLLFDRFGQLGSWSLGEVALFYGVVNTAFAVAEILSRGFDTFGDWIKSGEFDRLLLRPRSPALQLAGQEIRLRSVGRLLQGIVVLLWAAAALHIPWTAGRLVLLSAALAGGACLFYGLIVVQAAIAFWTTESLEVINSFTFGGVQAAQYPLAIYPGWFRRMFIYVIPLGCVSYFTVVAILGHSDPLGAPPWVGWVSPLAGPAFLLLALQVFRFGVRHYASTGS